jgi:hypothetical protein
MGAYAPFFYFLSIPLTEGGLGWKIKLNKSEGWGGDFTPDVYRRATEGGLGGKKKLRGERRGDFHPKPIFYQNNLSPLIPLSLQGEGETILGG